MVSPATWWRYLVQKFDHSISIGLKGYQATNIVDKKLGDTMAAHFLRGKLTECYWNKGKEMIPTIGEEGVSDVVIEQGDMLSMGHDGRALAMSLMMEGCKKNLNAKCNFPLRSRAM
ncbi:hypothetical protein QQ045_000623 [Rhodiola kirilowii]